MIDVILKKGKEKSLLRRHPWVYDTAVGRVAGKPAPGETVRVLSSEGRPLGTGAYSPASALRVRMWSFDAEENVDAPAFLRGRLAAAVAARAPLAARTNAVRLVFGEGDRIPGLIVDRYGDWLVTQLQSAGAEARKGEIAACLLELTGCKGVFDRSDAATRRREGLEPRVGALAGPEPPAVIEVVEDGVRYGVDVRNGHKTGFYIDQRDSRLAAQAFARAFRDRRGRGLRALNCFCYTGGFSLALAAGGADEVVSVDSSAEALAQAQANAAMNDLGGCRMRWVEADVFAYLREARERGEAFDLVILDPPKFASSHYHVERAARAYKDINLNGMRLLAPDGSLFTFSCSGAIDVDLFQKIVAGAVIDARREAWAVARFGAGADHPLTMTCPEGEYLKGLHLAMRP
ncbi:MAG: class I SAM-dependent rRNA methyltransferase [Duodenibacillus sp.]|nr:class I SAM-dependent rRNA methyltransferase [Duodenibacillus sp.]